MTNKSNGSEFITISAAEYDRLLELEQWLSYLEAAGINNTEAYEFAQEMRRENECE
jgi:hypothetical protein